MHAGGCTFVNCEGGDAPRVVVEKRIKKQKQFGSMTAGEIEEQFSKDKDQAGRDQGDLSSLHASSLSSAHHSDTGEVDGFHVEDPEALAISNYKQEKPEMIKTGQGGALDASWTVGGRVSGREGEHRGPRAFGVWRKLGFVSFLQSLHWPPSNLPASLFFFSTPPDLEKMKQIKDLDAWARDVKEKAMHEVEKARLEREQAQVTTPPRWLP